MNIPGLNSWRLFFGITLGVAALFLLGLAPFAISAAKWAPVSLVVVIPAYLIGGENRIWAAGTLVAMVAPITFLVIIHFILRSGKLVPPVSVGVFLFLFVISGTFAAVGWTDTVQFFSIYRALLLVFQSIVPPVALLGMLLLARKRMTSELSIFLHWWGLAWIVWSAFPWYGELL